MLKLPTKKQLRAYYLVEVMGETKVEAAKIMGVSRETIYRWLKRFKDEKLPPKKQLRAYYLVEIEGKKKGEVAKIMGVSRETIWRWLKPFYENESPLHKAKDTKTISLPGDFDDHIKDIF